MKNIGKHLNLFILFRLSLKPNKTNKIEPIIVTQKADDPRAISHFMEPI